MSLISYLISHSHYSPLLFKHFYSFKVTYVLSMGFSIMILMLSIEFSNCVYVLMEVTMFWIEESLLRGVSFLSF